MDETNPSLPLWEMLADRWQKTLKAKGLSRHTERGYLYTARRWSEWLAGERYDLEPTEVRSDHIDEFIAGVIGSTSAANGAHHYRHLRVFWAWLVKREKIATGCPMDDTEPPRGGEKLTPLLSAQEHQAIADACGGRDFLSRRDLAIILMFMDTGVRVSELAQVDRTNIDLAKRRFTIVGKGNRERWVGFGADTGLALTRYLRLRDKGHESESAALWLSRHRRPLTINGIQHMLNRRGREASVSGSLHPHRLRHDFSHRWKLVGGSDEGLMTIAGWTSEKMARHYGKSAQMERALAEQQRLALGDRVS